MIGAIGPALAVLAGPIELTQAEERQFVAVLLGIAFVVGLVFATVVAGVAALFAPPGTGPRRFWLPFAVAVGLELVSMTTLALSSGSGRLILRLLVVGR